MEKKNIFISNQSYQQMLENQKNKNGKDFYWTTNKNTELPIFLDKTGPGSERPYTLGESFENSCQKFSNKKAFVSYNKQTKTWNSLTYKQLSKRVNHLALGLLALGIEKRSCIAILSYNRPEWNEAFWATILNDCIGFGIYMTNNPVECEHILGDSCSPVVFVEDQEQYEKIVEIKSRLPNLKFVVSFEDVEERPGVGVVKYRELVELGKSSEKKLEGELRERKINLRAGVCSILIYTSGTTGKSKGVMVSHDNMTSLYKNISDGDLGDDHRIVSFLPCSHIAALFFDICLSMFLGSTVYFTDKDALKGSLPFYLQYARPTMFLGVPRVYEKIQQKIMDQIENSNFLKKPMVKWALQTCRNEVLNKYSNKDVSYKYDMALKLINKIKNKLGFDKTRFFYSGAAPLKKSTKEFFLSMDAYINNFYGLSETTGGVTGLLIKNYKSYDATSCGQPLLGVEINIDEKDEISFRSRCCFMGYINREDKTQEAIVGEKWVKTGDLGKLNENNHLHIVGRIKEIIVTAGGENVAPYPIEEKIMSRLKDFISWAVVIGDGRKFLSLVLTVRNSHSPSEVPTDDIEEESKLALMKRGIFVERISELFVGENFEKVSKIIQEAIDYANSLSVSRASKIRKFCLLNRDFSIPTDEITPTLKLKRPKVEKHFAKKINQLYLTPSL